MLSGLVEMSYPKLSSPDRIEWIDYAERKAAANPGQIAVEVQRMAGYRTFGLQCEQLLNAVGDGRVAEHVVTPNPSRCYEPANLTSLALR